MLWMVGRRARFYRVIPGDLFSHPDSIAWPKMPNLAIERTSLPALVTKHILAKISECMPP